ncbi:hypothetical protein QQF64_020437 [Cirrhinus molitorella]|uniref:DDE-1 domain-containing protein n=1 Tax=Cirrhinus molitorella TaxID=172907 RepID=A0ABR3LCQ5_9TELE
MTDLTPRKQIMVLDNLVVHSELKDGSKVLMSFLVITFGNPPINAPETGCEVAFAPETFEGFLQDLQHSLIVALMRGVPQPQKILFSFLRLVHCDTSLFRKVEGIETPSSEHF